MLHGDLMESVKAALRSIVERLSPTVFVSLATVKGARPTPLSFHLQYEPNAPVLKPAIFEARRVGTISAGAERPR